LSLVTEWVQVKERIRALPASRALYSGVKEGARAQLVYGASVLEAVPILSVLFAQLDRSVLVVTGNLEHANRLSQDLAFWLGKQRVALFPPCQLLPYRVLAESRQREAERVSVLHRLARGEKLVVVAPVEALLPKLIPPREFASWGFDLRCGWQGPMGEIAAWLHQRGYSRVSQVECTGQYAVRGGILDVWPPNAELPSRVEFFGDVVETIRHFDPQDQRSRDRVERLSISPAREFLFGQERLERALEAARAELREHLRALESQGAFQVAKRLEESMSDLLAEDGIRDIPRSFFAFFYPEGSHLVDYLAPEPLVVLDEHARIREGLCGALSFVRERFAEALEEGSVLPSQTRSWWEENDVWDRLSSCQAIHFSLLLRRIPGSTPDRVISVSAQPAPAYRGQWSVLVEELRDRLCSDWLTVLVLSDRERCHHVAESLRREGVPTSVDGDPRDWGSVVVAEGRISAGIVLPEARVTVLSEAELFGRKAHAVRRTRSPERRGVRLESYRELNVGDYVVHVHHGIAQYLGIRTLEIGGVRRDYLFLRYAQGDCLYVPTDQIHLVQKYIGPDGHRPRLHRLGGGEWNRVKRRVRESVMRLARELLELYAVRQTIRGHAFPPDQPWQRDFEEAFPYEETPDQLVAVQEIKEDMEKPVPMDRLLCGDVGYGKTEVAMRAAFKAVTDSKQVAVLVPTTILAQQHYHTFRERFANYPVNIDVISRFRSAAEQRRILRDLRRGKIDIIIGTHRLLQDDVRFHDLGLLIIDEEHRFGVVHKERLKQLRRNVDCLSMSATPIPRTLHMALTGIRDMSVMETPPEDRYPVQTYVVEYNPALIRDAVLRELRRGGQVFYVHNRVQTIQHAAARLQELVPGARIAIAHGQMKEDQLEGVMLKFIERQFDVLVCTTIIESGLDIPNVNTLIVEDADQFGLAQLYQLRGRVGRSNRPAYAFFTYRPHKVLTEQAEKRLRTIREFIEFGSGFKIALRDLEIRGAGNLLGPEQHGFMVSVGFDLYCQLLEQAIDELRGQPVSEPPQVSIEINVDAYLPDSYVPDTRQRVEMYRQIARCRYLEDLDEVEEELRDRFGRLPPPVVALLLVARLRVLCQQLGIKGLVQEAGRFVAKFDSMDRLLIPRLAELGHVFHHRVVWVGGRQPALSIRATGSSLEKLRFCGEVLKWLAVRATKSA